MFAISPADAGSLQSL